MVIKFIILRGKKLFSSYLIKYITAYATSALSIFYLLCQPSTTHPPHRSHAIFTFYVERRKFQVPITKSESNHEHTTGEHEVSFDETNDDDFTLSKPELSLGRLHLIDLASVERQDAISSNSTSNSSTSSHNLENHHINLSLSAFGECVFTVCV